MIPIGMLLALGSYGVTSWGYILLKGYDISLRQWFSPLHPYTGALAAAGTVPQGQVFPTGKGSPAQAQATSQQNPQQVMTQ